MTLLENILLILLIAVIVTFLLLYLLIFRRNTNYEYEEEIYDISSLTESMDSILKLIDILIEIELIEKTRFSVFTSETDKSSIMHADNTITEISTAVYSYLNKKILITDSMLFSSEGLINYIQKRTMSSVLLYINKSIQG